VADQSQPGESKHPPTPRWVKLFAVIAVIAVALLLVLAILGGGEHGPQRHLPGDENLGDHTPPVQHSP
jgi:hypothetical protein